MRSGLPLVSAIDTTCVGDKGPTCTRCRASRFPSRAFLNAHRLVFAGPSKRYTALATWPNRVTIERAGWIFRCSNLPKLFPQKHEFAFHCFDAVKRIARAARFQGLRKSPQSAKRASKQSFFSHALIEHDFLSSRLRLCRPSGGRHRNT